MNNLTFDPEQTLVGKLNLFAPREAIQLGIRLCEAVERSVGADGCHGAIWPGNVTPGEKAVTLGPCGSGTIAGLEPDALEFISPEQFWNGALTPASDVYSIGLILYTALNDGIMPFFEPEAQHTPEERAFALQNRMKGTALPYPTAAGRELGSIIEKAISFQAENRYESPAYLKLALEALPESAAIPAVAPVIPMTPEEVQNAHSYKVDKDFEKIVPEKPKKAAKTKRGEKGVDENMNSEEFRKSKKKKGRWILPAILILLILAALALLLRGCRDYYDPAFPIQSDPAVTAPVETDNPIHPPVATETPVPKDTPVPEVTPEPTETPAIPKYEIFVENVTWEQAKQRCEEKGGHLATVKTAEQLAEIISMAEEKGALYVWLGAYRAENAHWYYVTGEALDYTVWDKGEPSALDQDGTREDYLLLWYRKNVGTWSYNDMRNDPISVVPKTYSGKLAYICQYD